MAKGEAFRDIRAGYRWALPGFGPGRTVRGFGSGRAECPAVCVTVSARSISLFFTWSVKGEVFRDGKHWRLGTRPVALRGAKGE